MGLLKGSFSFEFQCQSCKHQNSCEVTWRYGPIDVNLRYKLGDRIPWDGPYYVQDVRDRRRKLEPFRSPLECKSCKAPCASAFVVVIRDDVFSNVELVLPPSRSWLERTHADFPHSRCLDTINFMHLEKRYGIDKVMSVWYDVASQLSDGRWFDFISHWRESGPKLQARAQEPESPQFMNALCAHADVLRREYPPAFWIRVRDRLINTLAGHQDHKPDAYNILQAPVECGRCGKRSAQRIPLKYGACRGYEYEINGIVDWECEGWLPCVRDPELQYVVVEAAACPYCAYESVGVVTVGHDKIESLAVMPEVIVNRVAQERRRIERYEAEGKQVLPFTREDEEELYVSFFLWIREYGLERVLTEVKYYCPIGGMPNNLQSSLGRSQDRA